MDLQCYQAFTISYKFYLQIMNQEASEGLGFSERGLGKAYHAGKNRI